MGNFVLDYVEEVCGDSQLTAADPVDASLLDGALVKEVSSLLWASWCRRGADCPGCQSCNTCNPHEHDINSQTAGLYDHGVHDIGVRT